MNLYDHDWIAEFFRTQAFVLYAIADGLADSHTDAKRRLRNQGEMWLKEAECAENMGRYGTLQAPRGAGNAAPFGPNLDFPA